MATILRTLSYKYQWLYDTISRLAALGVGGEGRFRSLALQGLDINANTKVLDLCCGGGAVTQILAARSQQVTALDASPVALQRAARITPNANYVEGLAQDLPFSSEQFDLVHVSAALHEMDCKDIDLILKEVYRVLQKNGVFAIVDFHRPTNALFWLPLATFLWLFETETSWQLIETDLQQLLQSHGFQIENSSLHAGGSLQVIQARKPI